MKCVNISLLVQSPRYRRSLSALLASLPGVQVVSLNSQHLLPDSTSPVLDIVLFEGSMSSADHVAALQRARQVQPGLKTILLLNSCQMDLQTHMDDIDLILPVDATAGEIFFSIDRLTG